MMKIKKMKISVQEVFQFNLIVRPNFLFRISTKNPQLNSFSF